MLTRENITSKNFTYHRSQPKISGTSTINPNDNLDRDIYLAVAVKEKENAPNIEFPIKLTHDPILMN